MAPRKKRPTSPTTRDEAAEYPSLREHLASRRRFLGLAGASLAAGALHAACNRSLGAPGDPDATVPLPDATPPQPDTGPVPGGERPPDYYTIRIPVSDDLSCYLMDEGYAQFYVEVVTYMLDSANALQENLSDAEEVCRQTVSEYTYDSLITAAGVTACEADLLTNLDELVMELEGHTDVTLEHATATFSYLEPYAEIGGAMGQPSYP